MSARRTGGDVGGTWVRAAVISVGFVALLWLVEAWDAISPQDLDTYGVRPRDDDGLVGVALAPVLHGGWDHLAGNTLPVLVLGFLVLVGGTARGLAATAIIWVVGGLGVWLTAPTYSIHLGASVLVFGWLVYLMLRGVFTRSAGEIILGIVLFLAYGGLLLGVLPGQPGVSWQGHLFGAVGGALAAVWVDRRSRQGFASY
ncbi:rhomboid family intramembrane serine protease [Nocardioides marmotae]|uniref:rhomboid family intramembrane serine protease n=1 Tax=Nocardioides marmotae TaxID=2663857 RepID=UPI0012B66B21|nr:rhomboid family intramembrane serine protease [Nocardioides marmotae]MBC9735279.1 rhomboid family intramembrane serine protease [Nocardioides marmotae]MTB86379.1 rhomboid family intramembrane serine protease [Nocardioides marmotae]